MNEPTSAARLRELELSYTERVNLAVAEDRLDIVEELVAQFEVERGQLLRVA